MIRHPLNFLDDRRCGLLRFAAFEDEMVAFEREGEVFDLFAISLLDRFCSSAGRMDASTSTPTGLPTARGRPSSRSIRACWPS